MPLYSMQEILKDANERKYGVGFFNAINLEMVRALIEASEELNSPIIIGTAEALLGFTPFEYISNILLDAAKKAKVPVAVHFDHCYNFTNIILALKWGFGSVMFDGSRHSYESNVKISSEISKVTSAYGAGLECELGCVGGLEAENGEVDDGIYTNVEQAVDFIAKTNLDFLAISIGTVHGVYKVPPKLDLKRLADIRARVDVPLVLHGGSGLSDDDFRNVIRGGISKINIYTDIVLAARAAAELAVQKKSSYAELLGITIEGMKEQIKKKLTLFGSSGKA